jgi:hypothetical protein|tara:strand:- start:1498 stop:1929 length:432 start_codon:yes stop_codon:yes gene_type:complete
MKDLVNSIAAVSSLAAEARQADTNGAGVDLQGFESATAVAMVGAEGITLSGTNFIEFKIEHSDDDSTYTAVTSANDVIEGTVDSNGVFAKFDDNAEAPAVATIGYRGGKRYVRIVDERSGTHGSATATAAVIIKGHPRHTTDS